MRLFLDTSVMLSASTSAKGASREIFRHAPANGWLLVATPYAIDEVLRHLPDFPRLGHFGLESRKFFAVSLVEGSVLTWSEAVAVAMMPRDARQLFLAMFRP